jgi:hypothetical protein
MACGALVIAGVLVGMAGGGLWLVAGIGLAVAGVVLSRFKSVLALAAGVLALSGLIALFVVPPESADVSTWLIVVPRVLLGLAALACVMVFVERE